MIEAVQWDRSNFDEVVALNDGGRGLNVDEQGRLGILTLEGLMYANPGDWIIKGVQGELYLCKPDFFAATYEPVETALVRNAKDECLVEVTVPRKRKPGGK